MPEAREQCIEQRWNVPPTGTTIRSSWSAPLDRAGLIAGRSYRPIPLIRHARQGTRRAVLAFSGRPVEPVLRSGLHSSALREATSRPRDHAPLASGQAVRRLTLDQEIEGSNPSSPAIILNVKRAPGGDSEGPVIGGVPLPVPLRRVDLAPEDAVHPIRGPFAVGRTDSGVPPVRRRRPARTSRKGRPSKNGLAPAWIAASRWAFRDAS